MRLKKGILLVFNSMPFDDDNSMPFDDDKYLAVQVCMTSSIMV
jgi:hypothetical protein